MLYKMNSELLCTLVTLIVLTRNAACSIIKDQAPQFSQGKKVAVVITGLPNEINEASGVCASRTHTNVLYTHNDSGDTPRIFAFSAISGSLLGTIAIDEASALDWEDIACGPCAGGSGHCIYIADTGGNSGGVSNTIFRIREPLQIKDQNVTLDGVLKFSWNQTDCETVMVDNIGEVYLLSKVSAGDRPKLVQLPSDAWGSNTRRFLDEGVYLPITSKRVDPVAGDISPSGKEVLVKLQDRIYYWYVPDRNYSLHLQSEPISVPYILENQGEAVCFDADGNGYYTISEGSNPALYYYERLTGGSRSHAGQTLLTFLFVIVMNIC